MPPHLSTAPSAVLATLAVVAPATALDLPELQLASFDTKTPEVAFDVPQRLHCRDVTTAEFLSANPDRRLVEVAAPVSLLLLHGEARRVRDVVIEIDGGSADLVVHDYFPRTELRSELAEPIEVRHTEATDNSVGASLGGKLSGDFALAPTISGSRSTTDQVTETRRELPPKEPVIVSGTISGRRGVYFKLRRSTQTTLEGEQTFRVTFDAPADWSGGELDVRCVARGEKQWLFITQRRVWQETEQPVQLRLATHRVAKPAVEPVEELATATKAD